MTELLSFFFMVGAFFVDTLEGWTLALIATVIALDCYIGLRARSVMIFTLLQVSGLVVGYLWAISMFREQDVSGPYAWAIVVGVWIFCIVVFHACWVGRILKQ